MAEKPPLREIALEKYKELGPTRTMAKLLPVLSLLTPAPPPISTLKYWSKTYKWAAEVAEYDRQAMKQVTLPELPSSPSAINKRRKAVFRAKDELNTAAQGFLRIVNAWTAATTKVTSERLKDARNITTILDGAIKAIEKVEVLEGRVSDRTAEEKKLTVDEIREKAKESSDKLIARASAVAAQMQSREEKTLQ